MLPIPINKKKNPNLLLESVHNKSPRSDVFITQHLHLDKISLFFKVIKSFLKMLLSDKQTVDCMNLKLK